MADAVAAREARRRRILVNSESRIKKITGKDNFDNSQGTGNETLLTTGKNVPELSTNGLLNNKIFEEDKLEAEDEAVDKRNGIPFLCSNYQYGNFVNSNNDLGLRHRKQNAENFHSNEFFNVSAPNENTKNLHTVISVNPVQKFLLNRFAFVLLSFGVNILLVLKLGHLFGEVNNDLIVTNLIMSHRLLIYSSWPDLLVLLYVMYVLNAQAIAIPYFGLTLARLCIKGISRESQDGSFLIAALILCNVRPELTYIIKTLLRIFTAVFNNLALYIFSFVLIHYAIFYYFLGFEFATVQ